MRALSLAAIVCGASLWIGGTAPADEFQPLPEYAGQLGAFPSPLKFYDGTPVATPADWPRRREEIRQRWHEIMGPWPALIAQPRVEILETTTREGFTQKKVRVDFEQDPELIGGLVTRIGSTVYDGSVRNQLQLIKEKMAG